MRSTATDVSTYLEEVPIDRHACLAALRDLCVATLTGYDEGMPSYTCNGTVEVAWASQKNHIALYVLKQDVVNARRALLQAVDVGKSCIKYTKPSKIDFDVVRQLLIGTRESSQPAC